MRDARESDGWMMTDGATVRDGQTVQLARQTDRQTDGRVRCELIR